MLEKWAASLCGSVSQSRDAAVRECSAKIGGDVMHQKLVTERDRLRDDVRCSIR